MNTRRLATALALSTSLLAYSAHAANFEVTNGQTATSTQLIGTGANETGTVDQGGAITINTAIDAIQSQSTGGTVVNNGTIDMTGTTGANAIEVDNENNRVTNNGIMNVGNNAGMISVSNGTVFINNGTITLGSGGGVAIFQGAGSGNIVNNGSVISTSTVAIGLVSTGDNTTITNNGYIHFTGSSGEGMQSNALNNMLVNNGTIDVTDVGIEISDTTSTITNNGTIHSGSYGVVSYASGNTITNSGHIHTTGNSGNGMFGDAASSTLINTGTGVIQTDGSSAFGMITDGANSTITNYGSITTTGASADGMNSLGINSTLTNNGTITTSNSNALGVHANATGNTLINNGTISGNAFNTDGLSTDASNTTMINNGRITESGTFADGMGTGASTSGQTLINNGTITVNGTGGGQGPINNFSTGSTITNNGTLISTGSGAKAIINNAAGNTVILGADSTTVGDIAFNGSGNALHYDLTNATERGGSVIYFNGSVTGTATTSITNPANLPANAHVLQSGNNVAVVTGEQFASSSQTVTQTLDYTGDIINQRQEMALLGGGVDYDGGTQYAAASINDASPASGYAVRDHNMAWTEAFGSYQERPQDGGTDYSQGKAAGVLAGVDLPQGDSGIRSGLYVGGVSGTLDIGQSTYRIIDSDGALAGGYLGKSFGNYFVSGQLAGGWLHNGSERNTGVDEAGADYDSIFLSPSVTVMRPIPGNSVTLVPQATVRYTSQWDTAYNETGSVEDEHVGSHNTSTLEARALMEAHFNEMQAQDGMFQPSLRAGVQYQTFLGSRSVDMSTFGSNINFDPSGGDNTVDGVIGATLAYKLTHGPELYADGEGDIGLNKGGPADNFGITGRFGARWKF